MFKRTVLAVATLLTLALPRSALAQQTVDQPQQAGRIIVVSTTTQVTDFARAVGGDRIEVRGLLTANVDPHEYEPTTADLEVVATADMVLLNGVGLDAWIADAITKVGGSNIPQRTVSEGVQIRKGDDEDDPHIWQSVANAQQMVKNVRDSLINADPDGGDQYRANTDAYLAQLDTLDAWVKEQISSIPTERRKMVTNHDAFSYYIERYGLTFVGSVIPHISDVAEPTAQEVADLIRKIRDQKVPAIFTESSINPALAKRISEDTGVKIVDSLYGDTLGPDGSGAATYIDMIKYNTTTIVNALK